jgi:serine protease
VYDLLGREVATLVNDTKQPGTYKVTFDGSGLASGLYLYRLSAGSFVATQKCVLLR